MVILLILVVVAGMVYFLLRPKKTAEEQGGGNVNNNNEGVITEWDNTRTFSYSLTSRFTLELDGSRYPEANTVVAPAGIIKGISNIPVVSPPYYALRYEGVSVGTRTIKNNDFIININIYDQETSDKEINNSDYGFNVKYPASDILNNDIGYQFVTNNSLVRIDLPRNDYLDTNLGEAAFIVGASKDNTVVKKCLNMFDIEQKQDNDETINGTVFKVFEGIGAAAGNIYETKSYRVVSDNTCYELVLLIHSGNIGNYPSGAVKEFDKQKAVAQLKEILDKFELKK